MDINIYEEDDDIEKPSFCHDYEFLQNQAKYYVESAMDSSIRMYGFEQERDAATFILYILQKATQWGIYNYRNDSLDIYVKNIPSDLKKDFLEAQYFIERKFGPKTMSKK